MLWGDLSVSLKERVIERLGCAISAALGSSRTAPSRSSLWMNSGARMLPGAMLW